VLRQDVLECRDVISVVFACRFVWIEVLYSSNPHKTSRSRKFVSSA